MVLHLQGCPVHVQTVDGHIYDGILESVSPKVGYCCPFSTLLLKLQCFCDSCDDKFIYLNQLKVYIFESLLSMEG